MMLEICSKMLTKMKKRRKEYKANLARLITFELGYQKKKRTNAKNPMEGK